MDKNHIHYHIIYLRCKRCTVEQTAYLLCGLEHDMIACCRCGCTGMDLLEEDKASQFRADMVSQGLMWRVYPMPGEIGIQELRRRLGVSE